MVSTLASLQTSVLDALVMDGLLRGRAGEETRKSPTAGTLLWCCPSNSGVLSPSLLLPALRTSGSAHFFVRKGDQTAFTQLEHISSRGKKLSVTESHQIQEWFNPMSDSSHSAVCMLWMWTTASKQSSSPLSHTQFSPYSTDIMRVFPS